MIIIENIAHTGFAEAIRGMRNPLNSWEKSDSGWDQADPTMYKIGPNDFGLMSKLALGGPVHAKYRRMIIVYMDITAPLYWWKEFDTYKVGTVANSCSTMHKIHAKEFTLDDFSHEHLTNYGSFIDEHGFVEYSASYAHAKIMELVIASLNGARRRYLELLGRGRDWEHQAKQAWMQMIQLLPSSYNQKRTVMLSYEVLAGLYPMRHTHKLDEWQEFCVAMEDLPLSEVFTGSKDVPNLT